MWGRQEHRAGSGRGSFCGRWGGAGQSGFARPGQQSWRLRWWVPGGKGHCRQKAYGVGDRTTSRRELSRWAAGLRARLGGSG